MNDWFFDHLTIAGQDVSAALDACMADFDDLAEEDRRRVIRAGLRAFLAAIAKRQKVEIEDGHTTQLPLFASVRDGLGHWLRVDYCLVGLDQLRGLVSRERDTASRITERLGRMDADLRLYERHPDLPCMRAVWDVEGVAYRIVEAAPA